jgi:hypothetical protein
LLLPQAFSMGIPLTVGFRLSRSLCYQGAPFPNFSFTRWSFGYHEAFHDLFFHTMEFRLSQSLSRTFLSHDGISAITEPFTNFSFMRWNFGYHRAFLTLPFHMMEFRKTHIWGKTLFIYVTKSIYIGSALLKTLPLDLESPLQGK